MQFISKTTMSAERWTCCGQLNFNYQRTLPCSNRKTPWNNNSL